MPSLRQVAQQLGIGLATVARRTERIKALLLQG
jgi:Trp operon repressor